MQLARLTRLLFELLDEALLIFLCAQELDVLLETIGCDFEADREQVPFVGRDCEIDTSLFAHILGSTEFRKALRANSCVIVREEGKIAGVWLFYRLLTRPILRDIGCVVSKTFRGRGIGARLVQLAKEMADREGRCIAFDCKAANPACAFWDKMGFRRVGERRRGKTQELYHRYFYASKASVAMCPAIQPGEGGSIPTSTLAESPVKVC